MLEESYMELALDQARVAASQGEVPVGAVVVYQGKVIASGSNVQVQSHDPTGHAEIIALRAAAVALGNYRLNECELFVTLEPCAMCSGAILNARLKRLVYGASEPKTGAAGSVIDLFSNTRINHQTEVVGGILGKKCGELIKGFFRERRSDQRQTAMDDHPLRDDALRTPDDAFAGLACYPWTPHYLSDLPSLNGLRLHYLDEQHSSSKIGVDSRFNTYLCMHEIPGWSYDYRKMIATLLAKGHRVIAPDLIGCGKSDKPKKSGFHTLLHHRGVILELVEKLELCNVVLVVPQSQAVFGLTLPMAAPLRYRGLMVLSEDDGQVSGEIPIQGGIALWNDYFRERALQSSHRVIRNKQKPGEHEPYPNQGYRNGMRKYTAEIPIFNLTEINELLHEVGEFWIRSSTMP